MSRRAFAGLVLVVSIGTSGVSHAGRLVTPPLTYGDERAICSVMNGEKGEIGPFTITILRLLGSTADQVTVTSLGAAETALLVAAEIGTASSVSCVVEGKGISGQTPVSLCLAADPAPSTCLVAVQAP
jgi:hypothetical protein